MSMCKVNKVKAARKAQGVCGKCRQPIEVGTGYLWWKGRYTPKYVRCLKLRCYPQQHELETNSLRADHMQAEAHASSAETEPNAADAAMSLRTAIELVEGIVSSLEDRLSSWDGTGLENSEQYAACESSKDDLEAWKDAAESVADALEQLDDNEPDRSDFDSDDDFDEASAEYEQALDEARAELEPLPELDLGA